MALQFNTTLWAEGESILIDANETAANINDTGVRNELQNTFASAAEAKTENTNILASLYQYGWIFVIVVAGLVFFLLTRQTIETRQGGGGFV